MENAILAGLVFAPLALTLLLKSNAALAFLSVCASFVVISFASADLEDLTGQLQFSIDSSILNLIIIGLPLLLTLLLTRRAYNKKLGMILHSLTALAAGGLLAFITVPLLTELVNINFSNFDAWSQLQNFQGAIIGAGVFLSLVIIWTSSLKKPHHKDKKHK